MNHNPEYANLAKGLIPFAKQAGKAIMDIYTKGVDVDEKCDGSPVTAADREAEVILLAGLKNCAPDIAVISEEDAESHDLSPPSRFFLVDPLDGTREFIKADGKGAFTVNIALIESGLPVFGIVYAPALNDLYWGGSGLGAAHNGSPIVARNVPQSDPVALASLSHRDEKTNAWLAQNNVTQIKSIGSSLKFCLVARGEADLYPRFGPTMEWDTAAGHAILQAAGGRVQHPDGRAFTYGKPHYKNGPFIAMGR